MSPLSSPHAATTLSTAHVRSADRGDTAPISPRHLKNTPRVRGSANALSGKSANVLSMRAMYRAYSLRVGSRSNAKLIDPWYAVSTDRSVPGTFQGLLRLVLSRQPKILVDENASVAGAPPACTCTIGPAVRL